MRVATLVSALAVAVAVLGPLPAAAQAPDPAAVDAALVAVAREAQALVELGALDGDDQQLAGLRDALAPLGPPPPSLATALPPLDDAAASAWGPVRAALDRPSRDADQAGQPLSQADRDAAGAGEPVSIAADVYLRGLDHLVRFDGAAPETPSPPDPAGIAAALTVALAAQPPATTSPTTPTTEPPPTTDPATTAPTTAPVDEADAPGDEGDDGGSDLPLVALAVAGIALTLLIGVLVTRSRPAKQPATLDALLDVSRRLTAAAASGDIDRAIVRDALGLVPAQGAALVRRSGDELVLGHESHAGLVVADQMAGGVVQRVAETGQPLLQVSASEPAIRQLPVSLAAVPLVGGGTVTAVLVLLREPDRPFSRAESDLLVSLAPIAAAALQSAGHAQAAIEESLLDPLTGVGNRRRLDADLATVAADDPAAQLALVLADIDHFKAVNDTHGHPAGDEVLRNVAAALRAAVRPLDHVYRFGGEEFCLLLHDSDAGVAAQIAERARATVASASTAVGDVEVRVTASFGVASGRAATGAELVALADQALYAAKAAGRDQVVVADG